MADQKSAATDPFTAWRDWLGQAERQLNSFFNSVMGTEQYTRAMGQFNDFSLNMQKSMSETMGRYFSSLNLPTRDDLTALGRRLTAIEDRLSAMESGRSGSSRSSEAPENSSSNMPRPPRTRKAPTAKGKGN
jgi:polyhydroxyalkanoic acid synthase PhaR subunit